MSAEWVSARRVLNPVVSSVLAVLAVLVPLALSGQPASAITAVDPVSAMARGLSIRDQPQPPKRELFYIDSEDERGWLVLRRRDSQLVLATSWTAAEGQTESEGSCFVGERSGRWFQGTFTASPGASPAWVRLKRKYGGSPTRTLVDQRSRDYSRKSRVWTAASAKEIRGMFDVPTGTSFADQIADCVPVPKPGVIPPMDTVGTWQNP